MGRIKIEVDGYECERCGHRWAPVKRGFYPWLCPKCKSPYWDKPRKGKPKEKEAK